MSDFGQPPGGGGWGTPPPQGPPNFGAPPQGPPNFGGPPQGFNPNQAPYPPMQPQQQGASGLAIASLVLAILSFFCGAFLFSIPAIIMGKIEMGKILRGESSKDGETLAKVGYWLGIANVVFYGGIMCLYLVFMVAMVGFAAVSQPH